MRISFALRLLLLALVLAGCPAVQQGGQAAARYSDEAINAAKALLRTADDAVAVSYLDDVARTAAAEAAAVEVQAISWSQRVESLVDGAVSKLVTPPDDVGRMRAFVVGSTCDALKAADDGVLTSAELDSAIQKNRASSGLPDLFGLPEAIDDVKKGIQTVVTTGNISNLSRALVCGIAS